MMKLISTMLILTSSAFVMASDLYLAGLNCQAANGVSLKTLTLSKSGTHIVQAEWGGFTKLFKAQLAQISFEQPVSIVALVDKAGDTLYKLELALNSDLRGYQMAEGSLMGVGLDKTTYKIANVNCRVQLEDRH